MRSRACVNEDQVSKMAFEIDSVVRGYHVYKDVWDAHIGTELLCLPESSNREDRYAVAVIIDGWGSRGGSLFSSCQPRNLFSNKKDWSKYPINKIRSKISRYTVLFVALLDPFDPYSPFKFLFFYLYIYKFCPTKQLPEFLNQACTWFL